MPLSTKLQKSEQGIALRILVKFCASVRESPLQSWQEVDSLLWQCCISGRTRAGSGQLSASHKNQSPWLHTAFKLRLATKGLVLQAVVASASSLQDINDDKSVPVDFLTVLLVLFGLMVLDRVFYTLGNHFGKVGWAPSLSQLVGPLPVLGLPLRGSSQCVWSQWFGSLSEHSTHASS